MRRHSLALVCGLFSMSTMAISAQEATPPDLQTYLKSAATTDFIRAAQGFLETHPTSDYAPRVALDLLMVAERIGDSSLGAKSKARLLFSYPQSIQTHHVLMAFADEEAFRTFLTAQVKDRVSAASRTLPGEFVQILQLAVKRFPTKLLDDNAFLIMTYCLAEAAGDTQICQALLPTLVGKAAKQPKIAPVVGICLDTQRPLVDRIQQLHNTQSKYSRFPVHFYLTRLSDVEQQNPRIRRIGMEIAIQSRDYPQALEHHRHLPATIQAQPQIMFWHAWALTGKQEDPKAREVLQTLIADHGQSVWAEPARTYLDGLHEFDARLTSQVEQLLNVTQRLKDDLSLLQATILFDRDNGDSFTIRLASSTKGNLFEVAIEKNGTLAVAYRTAFQDAMFYLPSQAEIVRWPKAGPIPMPNITLDRQDDGQFVMNAQLGFEANLKLVGDKGLQILESPYLSTHEGVKTLLEHWVRRGGLIPAAPEKTADGNTVYRWLRPQVDTPQLRPFTVTLTPDHRITAVAAGSIRVTSLQYGAPGSFDLQTYTWPDMPQQNLEKADFTMIMSMMGAVIDLFKKPDSAD